MWANFFAKKHFLKFDDFFKKMKILQQNIALYFLHFGALETNEKLVAN
jgi:hypothetical protein